MIATKPAAGEVNGVPVKQAIKDLITKKNQMQLNQAGIQLDQAAANNLMSELIDTVGP